MAEKSPIKKRILEYIEYQGISNFEFCKRTGFSKGVLEQDSGITEKNIIRFLTYDPKVSVKWLILGEGEMYGDKNTSDNPSMAAEPGLQYIKGNKAANIHMIEDITDQLASFEKILSIQQNAISGIKDYFKSLK